MSTKREPREQAKLSSETLHVRTIRPEDIEAVLKLYNYYVDNSAITFATVKPSLAEFTSLVEHTLEHYPFLVAEHHEHIVGYCYAHRLGERGAFEFSVELSIYVDHTCHHSGVGKALYTVMERELMDQGLLNLYVSIATPMASADPYLSFNSLKFHEHMGYQLVGTMERCGYKFGRFYSLTWMQKLLPITTQKLKLIEKRKTFLTEIKNEDANNLMTAPAPKRLLPAKKPRIIKWIT